MDDVQYVGNTLRLPVVNEGDMERPFGSSVFERDVRRIVVNPFSDNPRTFVPESENAKFRDLCHILVHCMSDVDGCDTCALNGNPYDVSEPFGACDSLRELLEDMGVTDG